MSDFRANIRDYIAREALPVEKFGHQPRLYALTLQIGAGLEYDDDVVFAAAWLHDIGVFTGHRPIDPACLAVWDNVAYAASHVPLVLRDAGFPPHKIEAVVEAIRTHQPASQPKSMEGTILRDADILEQLGAIGALRTVCKIGRDTRYPTFTAAAKSLRLALATLPPQIRLEAARAMALPRIESLKSFLEAVDREAGAELH